MEPVERADETDQQLDRTVPATHVRDLMQENRSAPGLRPGLRPAWKQDDGMTDAPGERKRHLVALHERGRRGRLDRPLRFTQQAPPGRIIERARPGRHSV